MYRTHAKLKNTKLLIPFNLYVSRPGIHVLKLDSILLPPVLIPEDYFKKVM